MKKEITVNEKGKRIKNQESEKRKHSERRNIIKEKNEKR